jgi:polyhydroxyalkanoate synthesis regulator phasin
MGADDLRDDVRELRRQVEALREALGLMTEPYREIANYLDRLQGLASGYFRLLDLYAKYGSVSPELVVPGLKDDISKHIVSTLFEKADRNISQITDAVKGKRGTASRRIVRERIQELERKGILISTPGSRGSTYRVADDVAAKWSEVLGLSKYGDQPKKTAEE